MGWLTAAVNKDLKEAKVTERYNKQNIILECDRRMERLHEEKKILYAKEDNVNKMAGRQEESTQQKK